MNSQKPDTHLMQSTVSVPWIDMFSLFQQVKKVSRKSPQTVVEDTRDYVFQITHTSSWKRVLRELPKLKLQPPIRQEITPKQLPDNFTHFSEEIPGYQNQVMARVAKLREAGIIYEEGIWYFDYLKTQGPWSRIDEWFFQTFPSPAFHLRHKIETIWWRIKTPASLSKLFRALGFRIATFAEQKIRWARLLENAQWPLFEAGIVYEDGVWYFGDAQGSKNWPKIQGRPLGTFPNVMYNKDHEIGNSTWIIQTINGLSELFCSLGLTVATKEEERARWARILKQSKQELESMWIIEENGIWYFGDAWWNNLWPKIQGKSLGYFPNATFLKEYWLANNDRGQMSNPAELIKLFAILGLKVATFAQEKARWARMITEHEDDFKEARIFQKNGVWDFSKAKGHVKWPYIKGQNLVTFPNTAFRKTHHIGDSRWYITNATELSKLFLALWFQVIPPVSKNMHT